MIDDADVEEVVVNELGRLPTLLLLLPLPLDNPELYLFSGSCGGGDEDCGDAGRGDESCCDVGGDVGGDDGGGGAIHKGGDRVSALSLSTA